MKLSPKERKIRARLAAETLNKKWYDIQKNADYLERFAAINRSCSFCHYNNEYQDGDCKECFCPKYLCRDNGMGGLIHWISTAKFLKRAVDYKILVDEMVSELEKLTKTP